MLYTVLFNLLLNSWTRGTRGFLLSAFFFRKSGSQLKVIQIYSLHLNKKCFFKATKQKFSKNQLIIVSAIISQNKNMCPTHNIEIARDFDFFLFYFQWSLVTIFQWFFVVIKWKRIKAKEKLAYRHIIPFRSALPVYQQ